MTRSKMLQKLVYIFDNYENPRHLAEIALWCVEKQGMLPPDILVGTKATDPYKVHYWESEDNE